MLNQAQIAINTVWYLYYTGEYSSAETLSRISVEVREKVLGLQQDTLHSISRLGVVLGAQGRY